MADTHIEVMETQIWIRDLQIPRRDVVEFLRAVPESEREVVFIRAVEVGMFCLQRAGTTQDMEFVKRQVESLLTAVASVVRTIPEAVQKALLDKVGVGDGQVLRPIQALITDVTRTTTERLQEVKELLSQEIDPARDSSTLAKALRCVRDLLDPNRTDSVQARISMVLQNVAAQDGALARAVRAVVSEAITPLADEVNRLGKDIRAREAATEAIAHTTEKGTPYEELVVAELEAWSKVAGAEIHYVGADNRPGDIIVKLPATSLAAVGTSLVIEARDRESSPLGRRAISTVLSRAMAERNSNAAIYLSRFRDGLAKEIGEWSEGGCESGPWIATTYEHLTSAVRFLVAQQQLAAMRKSRPEIDAAAVEAQLGRIRTSLARVATINHKVTDVRRTADEIRAEAEALRDEVRSALSTMEDCILSISLEEH
jgi:hypothetical protein